MRSADGGLHNRVFLASLITWGGLGPAYLPPQPRIEADVRGLDLGAVRAVLKQIGEHTMSTFNIKDGHFQDGVLGDHATQLKGRAASAVEMEALLAALGCTD